MALVAALVLVGAMCLYVFTKRSAPSGVPDAGSLPAADSPALRALVAAMDGERLFEARLSGGYRHAAWSDAPRAAAGPLSRGTRLAALRLKAESEERRPAPDLVKLAGALLVLGDIEAGIAALEQADDRAPKDAGRLNDLAVGYFLRFERGKRDDDLLRALDAVERAVRIDPASPEASFNRALILERIPLTDRAVAAWDAYLRLSSTDVESGWRTEATSRHGALAASAARPAWQTQLEGLRHAAARGDAADIRAAAKASPQFARELFEEQLLPAWATAMRDGAATAPQTLATMTAVAESLAAHDGDHLPLDTVTALRGGVATRAAATAFLDYDQGRRLYDADRFQESKPFFDRARTALHALGQPFHWRARFQYAVVLFYERKFPEAQRIFNDMLASAAVREYPSLLGRCHWLTGLMRVVPVDLDHRLADYRAALAAFKRAGERPNVGAVHMLLGESFQLYGNTAQGWTHRRLALAADGETRDSRRRHVLLLDAVRASLTEERPAIALQFCEALLTAALASGRAAAIAESYAERARLHWELQETDAASRDIASSREWLARVTDAVMVTRIEPFILKSQGEIDAQRSPAAARAAIDRALQLQREAGRHHHAPDLLRLRARTFLTDNDLEQVRANLDEGIREVESNRRRLDPQLRVAYLDQNWTLFKAAIEFQVTHRRAYDVAFHYAERGRARSLLDRLPMESKAVAARTLAEVQAALPPRIALISYLVFTDRVMTWVVRADRSTFVELPTTRTALRDQVASYRSTLERRDTVASARLARALHARLIAPLAAGIGSADTLVLIPDDILHTLPFPALTSTAGRFLAESHAVTTAPSASLFLLASARLRAHAAPREAVAVFSSAPGTPEYPALSETSVEADLVVRQYPRRRTIDAVDAAPGELVAAMNAADVVHISTHAQVHPLDAALSRLILRPPTPSAEGRYLTELDLWQHPLGHPMLVVLAACRTAEGPWSRAEGPLSLARPLLAAGVPAVLGSLWAVNDRPTRAFFARYHQEVGRDGDPVLALQRTQRAMLGDRDAELRDPASWAAFVSIGGARF